MALEPGVFFVRLAFLPLVFSAFRFADRMLPARSRVVLRVAQAATVAQMFLIPVDTVSTLMTFTLGCAVLPLACYGGDVWDRLLVSALLFLAESSGEMVGAAFWKVITDGALTTSSVASWANYSSHVAASLVGALVCFAVLEAFARQLPLARLRLHAARGGVVGFFVAQVLALYILGKGAMFSSSAGTGAFLGAAGLCLVCLVAAVEVLRATGRLRVREDEARRQEEIAHDLDALALSSQAEVDAMAGVAMLRHDTRNHLQVLRSLVEQGKDKDAATYALALAQEWESAEEDLARRSGEGGDV